MYEWLFVVLLIVLFWIVFLWTRNPYTRELPRLANYARRVTRASLEEDGYIDLAGFDDISVERMEGLESLANLQTIPQQMLLAKVLGCEQPLWQIREVVFLRAENCMRAYMIAVKQRCNRGVELTVPEMRLADRIVKDWLRKLERLDLSAIQRQKEGPHLLRNMHPCMDEFGEWHTVIEQGDSAM